MTALSTSLGEWTGRVTGRIDRLTDRKFALLSFLPGGVLVALFVIPPIIAVFAMSIFRIELLRTSDITVNFPNNYTKLSWDTEFLAAIPRTLLFGIGVTLVTLPTSLITALVLNRLARGASVLGIAVLLPWAVAGVVTGLFWKFIFQSHFGLATSIMTVFGLTDKPIDWLFDTSFAIVVAVIATAWRSVPLFALLLLAALKTIPESLYRAAKMDGATTWQTFQFVTLPGISRMLLVVTVLIVINALQVFDLLFTLTRGGPGRDTTVVIFYIFENTTRTLSFGYSSAMAIALLAVILGLTSLLWVYRLRGRVTTVADTDTTELSAPQSLPRLARMPVAKRVVRTDLDSASNRRRRSLPAWAGRIGVSTTAILLFVWLVGPVLWIFISSITPEGRITSTPPQLGEFSLSSYTTLLQNPAWFGAIIVSLQIAIYTTVLALVLGALAAYPLARLELPGKGVLTAIIILTQTIPAIVVVIPTLFLFRALGLSDTIVGLVLINVAFLLPLVIWLLRNVFEGVPRALESAARIDGCSRLGALFRVTIPAAAPGIAAVIILSLIGTWNEFLFAVTLGSKNTITVTRQLGFIDTLAGPLGSPPFTVLAAAGIIAIAPCIALVFLFHRRVVAGITEGFVKG